MKKGNEERVLIHTELGIVNGSKKLAENALPFLQKMIDAASEAELTLSAENFYSASTQPEKWAKKQFMEMIPDESVGAFKKKKSDQIEMLELPNLIPFISTATNFLNHVRTNQVPVQLLTIEADIAKINEGELNNLVESCSRYITHPKSKLIWDEYNRMTDQINKFNEAVKQCCQIEGIDLHNFKRFVTVKADESGIRLHPDLPMFLHLSNKFESEQAR